MKYKKLLGVILLIFSIILLLCLGVAIGFYKQIVEMGFEPNALFFFVGLLSFSGIIGGAVLAFMEGL